MSEVYSVSASSMFSIDENGKHSLEVAYKDSDGVDTGAYSEGDSFDEVLGDVLDQLDAAIANAGDAHADQEEAAKLQSQIDDLTHQLEELKARNQELEQKNTQYKKYKDFEEALNKITKDFDSDNIWNRWFK
jgi:predicted RNase H-like nuclease (RuvC/YqgF family)